MASRGHRDPCNSFAPANLGRPLSTPDEPRRDDPDRESSADAGGTPEQSEFPAPIWSHGEPRIVGATHVGRVRSVNQDSFGRFDDGDRSEILALVADGLGGHRGGEVASQMAIDAIGEHIFVGDGDPAARLARSIEAANEAILRASREDLDLDGMGTTIVAILMTEDGRSCVGHVGDSRLYRIRAGRIASVTEDHSLVATLVREGVLTPEQAHTDPRRNQILRALGVRDDVEVEVAPLELQAGDTYLLCSDGLHGMLEDDAIQKIATHGQRLEAIVESLIDAANEAGGTDNVTVMLAQIPGPMQSRGLRGTANRLIESTRSAFSRRDDK